MTKRAARIPDKLRQNAELRLVTRHRTKAAPQDAGGLVRELRVHQIELEMQNEERLSARHQLAAGGHVEVSLRPDRGSVVARSAGPGSGSVFEIRLPCSAHSSTDC